MPSKIYQVRCFLKENSRSLIDLVSDREDVEGFFAFRPVVVQSRKISMNAQANLPNF